MAAYRGILTELTKSTDHPSRRLVAHRVKGTEHVGMQEGQYNLVFPVSLPKAAWAPSNGLIGPIYLQWALLV